MKPRHCILVAACLGLLVACGGGPKSGTTTGPEKVNRPQSAPSGAKAQPKRPAAPATEAQANPKFAIMKPYFAEYLKQPLDGKINVFKSNLASFAPRVEIDEDTAKPDEEPKTPLEYYDTDSYRLVLIMSGTALSKALLVDPRDKSFIVQVGTKVGNRGGKVSSITPTEVRIEEPGRPPVIKALESAVNEMEKELQSVQEF